MMLRKTAKGIIKSERGDLDGEVVAVIATMGVVDADGDVVTPTTFEEGTEVPVAFWGHTYSEPPLGKARIEVLPSSGEVRARCRFFKETRAGNEAVQTMILMGERQEWSWGFNLIKSHRGSVGGQPCRFLDKIKLLEVSPVIAGASVGSRTVDAKGLTGRDLLKMSAGEIYAWADAALYADAKERVGADAPSMVKRFEAALADLDDEELGELQALAKKSASTPPLTNLDLIRIDVEARYADMPAYYRRAMVQGALGDLVERDLREQELTAGVSPSAAVASERVMRWARSPARL